MICELHTDRHSIDIDIGHCSLLAHFILTQVSISFSHRSWRNADRDMLSCPSCNQALAIALHSNLSFKATESLCRAYRQKLATAHEPDCPFRLDAEQFLRLDASSTATLPTYMFQVLPAECAELLERPPPTTILKKRVQLLSEVLQNDWKYPCLDAAQELKDYRLNGEDDRDGLALIQGASEQLASEDVSILTLAILGWIPIKDGTSNATLDASSPVASLGCPLCFSFMELTLEKKSEATAAVSTQDDAATPPTKKQRRLAMFCNPHDAHRHYCPYRCGFPKTVSDTDDAVWKTLLSRLYKEQRVSEQGTPSDTANLENPDQSYDRIRKILWSAIVPKKVDLTGDEDS